MSAVLAPFPRAAALDARSIGRAAVRALLDELAVYPKPGLVSFIDSGSHADMTAVHFVSSARSLRGYFTDMAAAGMNEAGFDALRRRAVEAEVAMLRATGGVNTHRGAIFTLGLLAAAAGWRVAHGDRGATLGSIVRARWGDAIAAHRRDPASHGSAVLRRHGGGGAQAEAAAGFPALYHAALPAYRAVVGAGGLSAEAAVQAFFALLACVDDTNLLHRGGGEGLRFAREAAREFLAGGGIRGASGRARALDAHRAFVDRRLSPGGCADLLAACLFATAIGD